MKNIFKYQTRLLTRMTCLVAFSLLIFSCDLDVEPESFRVSEDFYTSAEDLELAMISTYSSYQNVMNLEFNVTELRTDNTYLDPDRSANNDVDRFTLDRFTLNTTNPINESYYRACYKTIALANRVLANLDVVEDEEFKNQLEGEALFFRGLMHFNLVRLYGGIVLVDEILIGEEGFELSRSTEAEAYEFIINDLVNASSLLPSAYGEDDLGRATNWAAKGLLGKVYLTTGANYAEAITVLEEIRDSGEFALVDDYASLFTPETEINSEILFAVRYSGGNNGVGSPFPTNFSPRGSLGTVTFGDGDGLNIPTVDLVNSYDPADPRKGVSLAESYFNLEENEVLFNYIIKYNSENLVATEDGEVDWPVIRYADVLLMLAEAYIEENGSLDDALAELNKVRNRGGDGVGLPVLTTTDVSTAFDFKLALENERRHEFAFENHRYFDLLRTGRTLIVLSAHFSTEPLYNAGDDLQYTGGLDTTKLLLPIPQYEIDLNPSIGQNIGY
ncbi:RagB/SusD family nutrient uptake outer membrane protein [Aquimarina pacifica]|uniref:RagB/SusD family nutrient uptake outer membrane protein n=1 Tax=Aquimarina pacifica TaxID=1296415 RepID=UPI00047236D7|nr:RagB/SusD family nutrient uptake outer membrane protein [Aquimarina pacifica]